MKKYIGITMGDPVGIGPEICVKALANKEIYDNCNPIIFGDKLPLESAIKITNSKLKLNEIKSPKDAIGAFGTIDYINLNMITKEDFIYGVVNKNCGDASFCYITSAIEMALNKEIDAVATGPINKEAVNLAGHHFSGHTEIFSHYTNTKDYAMMLICDKLRVIHATTHVSMRNACDLITKERVLKTIELANTALLDIGLKDFTIGVAGLNAHSSENGMFGFEEEREIIPAIKEAQKNGLKVEGPIPPDTVFVKAMAGVYQIVVAMYHDQGHIPLKLMGFKMNKDSNEFTSVSGINTTIGLPIIRTSVDHGTAFDRAGKNISNEESLIDAILLAIKIANRR